MQPAAEEHVPLLQHVRNAIGATFQSIIGSATSAAAAPVRVLVNETVSYMQNKVTESWLAYGKALDNVSIAVGAVILLSKLSLRSKAALCIPLAVIYYMPDITREVYGDNAVGRKEFLLKHANMFIILQTVLLLIGTVTACMSFVRRRVAATEVAPLVSQRTENPDIVAPNVEINTPQSDPPVRPSDDKPVPPAPPASVPQAPTLAVAPTLPAIAPPTPTPTPVPPTIGRKPIQPLRDAASASTSSTKHVWNVSENHIGVAQMGDINNTEYHSHSHIHSQAETPADAAVQAAADANIGTDSESDTAKSN